MALRSTKEPEVQLKSSGGSQPFSPLQCRTALPWEQKDAQTVDHPLVMLPPDTHG